MVRSCNAIACHLINILIVLLNLASAAPNTFPDLIGQIVSSVDKKSLAIFKDGERVYAKHIGDEINGYIIKSIDYRYIFLQDSSGKIHQLMVGDETEIENVKKVIPGLEIVGDGDRIIMSDSLRRYIAEENLIKIMFQAGSEAFYDDEQNIIGYQLFEIEPESIYDLVGIQNFDIITHIDGVKLSGPMTAISLLKNVKHLDKFSFTYMRDGLKTTVDVDVTY